MRMASVSKSLALPEGWGADLLSDFQTNAFNNELATFVHADRWQQTLLNVAIALNKCTQRSLRHVLDAEDPSSPLLFVTAHNQFLASIRSAAAGQCLATYPTGRAAVESALYGWYLSRDIEAARLWNNKPTDKKEAREWASKFRFSALANLLSEHDQHLAEWAKYLHQTAIDLGAHPNMQALYSNVRIEESKTQLGIWMTYLHSWDQLAVATMKFTIETGLFCIRLFALAYPQFAQEINLADDIQKQTVALEELIKMTDTTKLK